jgi:GNAT superfamily N-acetyltransferase
VRGYGGACDDHRMAPPSPERIELVDAPTLLAAAGDLCDAYRAVFTRPPWDETDDRVRAFAEALPGWAAREGFAAAWVRDAREVIGFAFRVRTPDPLPAGGFYGLLRDRFGDAVAGLAGAVEVVELAVRPEAQGRGLGRQLLASIVADGRAWLVTRSAARDTVAFYHRLGWTELAGAEGLVILTHQSAYS